MNYHMISYTHYTQQMHGIIHHCTMHHKLIMLILLDKHKHPIMIIAEIKNTSAQSVTATSSENDNGNGSNGDCSAW